MSATDTRGEPWSRAHNAWFVARMNEIYYTKQLRKLKSRDKWIRIFALASSSGGVAALLAHAPHWVTIALGVATALVSAYSVTAALPTRIQTSAALLPQYTQLAASFRELYFKGQSATEKDFSDVMAQLDRLHVSEAEKLPDFDEKDLRSAEKAAKNERLGSLGPAIN